MDKHLKIAYACDDNYVKQTGISIISLLRNNRDFDDIFIYLIDMGISEMNKNKLLEIVDNDKDISSKLEFIKFKIITSDLYVSEGERHIKSIYAKFFLSRINEQISKILYLDSDTIIEQSLMELWNIDLNSKTVAGVKTVCKPIYKKALSIELNSAFINDGIILIDLLKWRENDYTNKCLDVINQFNGNPPVLSEGVINKVCKNDIYFLEPKYNFTSMMYMSTRKEISLMSNNEFYNDEIFTNSNNNPFIIHFSGNTYLRPWFINSDHPFKDYYYKYRNMSPWKNSEMKKSHLTKKIKCIRMLQKILPRNVFTYIYCFKNNVS